MVHAVIVIRRFVLRFDSHFRLARTAGPLLAATGCCFCLATLTGCARVETSRDYGNVAERVSEATGAPAEVWPDDDTVLERQVSALMEGGLTSDNAVRLALLNHPRLRAAYYRVGIARADVVQSRLFSNPMLAMSLRFPDSGGLANLMLDVTQNISDLWQLPIRARGAEHAMQQTLLDVARELSATALEAKATYYRAAASDRLAELAAENLAVAQRLLDTAQARLEAGAGSAVEVYLARSEVYDAELALKQAQLTAFLSRRDLAVLLGLTDRPAELRLAEALPTGAVTIPGVEAFEEVAMKSRLDLLAAEQAVQAAREAVDLERVRVVPMVQAGMSLEREARRRGATSDATGFGTGGAGGAVERWRMKDKGEGQASVIGPSIGATLPLFDQNQAGIARSEFMLRQTELTAESLRRQVVQDVRGAYESVDVAYFNAGLYRDQVLPLRETNLELSLEGYRAGKIGFLSVVEAQRALLMARGRHIEALQAAATAITELERVTGKPLKEVTKGESGE